jgi:hypothetical protein
MLTCAFCGVAAPGTEEADGVPPLTWTSAVEQGKTKWFCADCSRKHLRAMESKLDSEWW